MVISIVGSHYQKTTKEELQKLIDTLLIGSNEHHIRIEAHFFRYLKRLGLTLPEELSENIKPGPSNDLVISLGGDGTFLRAAKLIAGTDATILGINTGRLGFLAATKPEELTDMWEDILLGHYETEDRSMIDIEVETENGVQSYDSALNEVGLLKQETASMIAVNTIFDGEHVASFEGDGLLISTPTGSTAYALSVGGPVVYPECSVFVVCPVAPHMLNMRPLIIPDHTKIELSVSSRNNMFMLSTDGRSYSLPDSSIVRIKRSPKTVSMVRHPLHSYYETLRNKLMWGQDARQ